MGIITLINWIARFATSRSIGWFATNLPFSKKYVKPLYSAVLHEGKKFRNYDIYFCRCQVCKCHNKNVIQFLTVIRSNFCENSELASHLCNYENINMKRPEVILLTKTFYTDFIVIFCCRIQTCTICKTYSCLA